MPFFWISLVIINFLQVFIILICQHNGEMLCWGWLIQRFRGPIVFLLHSHDANFGRYFLNFRFCDLGFRRLFLCFFLRIFGIITGYLNLSTLLNWIFNILFPQLNSSQERSHFYFCCHFRIFCKLAGILIWRLSILLWNRFQVVYFFITLTLAWRLFYW